MTDEQLPHSGHRRTVVGAEASPHLVEVTLEELRAYRENLREEEEKISYWRRLIHARMDLLGAGSLLEQHLDVESLGRVLGDTGAGRIRDALHRVRAAGPLPDLPDLEAVWGTPSDQQGVAVALDKLAGAEAQLTEYRRSLHERIDEATAELIVRYRRDPGAALRLLAD